MFTDWTQTDPHYFYLRGAIMGCILTLLVVIPIINELRKRLCRTAKVKRCVNSVDVTTPGSLPCPTLEETLHRVTEYLAWWESQPKSKERSIAIGQHSHTKRRLQSILYVKADHE